MLEISISCKFCESLFENKPDLDAHIIASHKDLRPTYSCDQCAFTTNKLYNLKAHRKRHGYKEFKCTECDYETHERCKLQNHIQKYHGTGPARYQEWIKFWLRIWPHVTRAMWHGLIINPFECELCDFESNERHLLNTHTKVVHLGEKPHKCLECPESFLKKRDLIRHLCNVHNVEKPFKCEYCDNAFISASLLKQHAMVHSGKNSKTISSVIYRQTRKSRKIFGSSQWNRNLKKKTFSRTMQSFSCTRWHIDLFQNRRWKIWPAIFDAFF